MVRAMFSFEAVKKRLGALIRLMLVILTVAVALCTFGMQAFAAESADGRQIVRVGVYGGSLYSYQDNDGVWHGVDIECLTNIAQRSGLQMEFVDSVTDPDFIAGLENGTYDMLTVIEKTPDREGSLLFSESSLGDTDSAKVAVRASDDRWDYGNTEQLSQMKIGVVSSFSNNATFRSWCAERGVTPQIVEYPDIVSLTNALTNGEVDGEVYSALYGDPSAFRNILQLAPISYYYAFRKDDTQLKNKVDAALSQILVENPYYLSDLKNKYVDQNQSENLPYSNSEKAYIQQHPTLTVAVLDTDKPYYWKAEDGTDHGIIPDYYQLLASETGFQFRYASYSSPEEEIDAVKNGEVDLIGVYGSGIVAASNDGLAITNAISSVNNVLLTKSGNGLSDIKRIAVNQRSADAVKTSHDLQSLDADISTYGTASECFDALKSNKVDGIICGLPSATWIMNQTSSSGYSISPLPRMSFEFCIAADYQNGTLVSILDKGISKTKNSYGGIVTSNTLPGTDLRSFVDRLPVQWVAVAAIVLFALLITIIITFILLFRRQRESAAIEAAKRENEQKEAEIAAMERNAEEKNRFFSNISHDMRTPLNAVIGFSDLAKGPDVSPQEKDAYFDKIMSSGTLLLDLVNDTLTLSKMSSGKLELKLAPVDTEQVGASITTPLRESAAQKHITFVMDKSGYRPRTILADSLNLKKIFLNLLSNAVKYTPEDGHIWLTVKDDPYDGKNPDLVFTVKDDGIGISKDYLPHLFEPFSQEGRATGESSGTGLGLSIVKNLVDLMGGTISVESEVGKGTTFTIRLPFEEVEGASSSQATEKKADRTVLKDRRILLCEDNDMNAEIAITILKQAGMKCDWAANGRQGADMFERSKPGSYDAVLMDLRMPLMGGIEATRVIRASDRSDASTVPIIALTADAFEEDIRHGMEVGMNAYITKPIDSNLLFDVLVEQIRNRPRV